MASFKYLFYSLLNRLNRTFVNTTIINLNKSFSLVVLFSNFSESFQTSFLQINKENSWFLFIYINNFINNKIICNFYNQTINFKFIFHILKICWILTNI